MAGEEEDRSLAKGSKNGADERTEPSADDGQHNGGNGHGNDDNGKSHQSLPFLCLAALGIVYGDIGTSPIYALREAFFRMTAFPLCRPIFSAYCRCCSGR